MSKQQARASDSESGRGMDIRGVENLKHTRANVPFDQGNAAERQYRDRQNHVSKQVEQPSPRRKFLGSQRHHPPDRHQAPSDGHSEKSDGHNNLWNRDEKRAYGS